MKYVGNAFSLQMIQDGTFKVSSISKDTFDSVKDDCHSIMGHPEMAYIHGVSYNRESIKMEKGDILYVAQITSGRLPEKVKYLPPDTRIEYKKVEIL